MANRKADDICPRPGRVDLGSTTPHAPPIVPTSVWECHDTEQSEALLNGAAAGYVYQRDGHPNADTLAAKCCELHRAERTVITSSGMAALAAAVLSLVKSGETIVASRRLYGRSLLLLGTETERLGIETRLVDSNDVAEVRGAAEQARMIVVETISNPTLRVAPLVELAEIAKETGALLLVDNTFATPALCRPLEWGAHLVMESISKSMNGHSDVMLGSLSGSEDLWGRVPQVVAAWGLASGPFDCWLAERGLATLAVRVERASANAQQVAELLTHHPAVERVDYPGLADHPDRAATEQLLSAGGSMVTFHLAGGLQAANRFIAAVREQIPFCPSLGETGTTISHPESTSHRGLTGEERAALGIDGGTLRLSVGIEQAATICELLQTALDARP